MKKIYLIDDNELDQRALFGAASIDSGIYDDVLVHIEQLSPDDDMQFIVSDAVCVMMHRTMKDCIDGAYIDGSNQALSMLRNAIEESGAAMPYVLFSDGDNSVSYSENNPNVILSIKKSVFYERLIPFLDKYKQDGVLNLAEIAFGVNYKSQKAKELISCVISVLATHSNDEIVDFSWFEGDVYRSLYDIVELSSPAIGLSFDELMNDLIESEVTAGVFKNRINRILRSFNQNGENIYPWK